MQTAIRQTSKKIPFNFALLPLHYVTLPVFSNSVLTVSTRFFPLALSNISQGWGEGLHQQTLLRGFWQEKCKWKELEAPEVQAHSDSVSSLGHTVTLSESTSVVTAPSQRPRAAFPMLVAETANCRLGSWR